MASFVVLEPPSATPERAERAVLIRDGFAVLALIMPILWFLYHRMWLEALAYLAIGLALGVLGSLLGYSTLAPVLSILLSFLIGLEARGLRVEAMRRRGWTVWGVVEGENRQEAELRYAAEASPHASPRPPAAPPSVPTRPVALPRSAPKASSFGLLDYPRKS